MGVKLRFDQTLDLPREETFAYLADPRNRPEWQSSLDAIEMLDEGEPRVGMRWREAPAPHAEFEMEITELVPNERWSERGTARFGVVDVVVGFESLSSQRTRLSIAIDLRLHGPFRPFALGARLLLPPAMRADLRRIPGLVRERRAGAQRLVLSQ